MKSKYVDAAEQDALAASPPSRMAPPRPAAGEVWQELQGSIGNAAVARLLQGGVKSDAFVQRQLEDEPLGNSAAAFGLSERLEGEGSAAEPLDTGRRLSKEEAVALVDKHVEPKECFVWYEGNKKGWRPMPGTGCAHWEAHERGYAWGLKCDKGFTVRVRNITENLKKVAMQDVQEGDLWENQTDASHIGIVRAVNKTGDSVGSVEVEHDSVRSGGVVKTRFTAGLFYR